MTPNITKSSTKKGPGRMHWEPLVKDCRNDKKEMPRFMTGAKAYRKAIAKTLTKNY